MPATVFDAQWSVNAPFVLQRGRIGGEQQKKIPNEAILQLHWNCGAKTTRPVGRPIRGEGNVDLDDYADFESCLLGPGGGLDTGCECFDEDGDNDVDVKDFAAFQESFTG